jgi:hypothetical protein
MNDMTIAYIILGVLLFLLIPLALLILGFWLDVTSDIFAAILKMFVREKE